MIAVFYNVFVFGVVCCDSDSLMDIITEVQTTA